MRWNVDEERVGKASTTLTRARNERRCHATFAHASRSPSNDTRAPGRAPKRMCALLYCTVLRVYIIGVRIENTERFSVHVPHHSHSGSGQFRSCVYTLCGEFKSTRNYFGKFMS